MQRSHLESVSEAGCDEAGRGCLAGPVFAAAVILPDDFFDAELNDSKKMTEKQRDRLRIRIENEALSWAVASVSAQEIDKINILNASILAMHRALDKLDYKIEHILVDGNRFKPWHEVSYLCMIKGDARYANIAAASVLAKTHRDEYMEKIGIENPHYQWYKNKGYPTKIHRKAIAEFGISAHHRKTFRMGDENLKLKF